MVSMAPDIKASEIQKIKDMVNTTTLMGKPLDITESQISQVEITKFSSQPQKIGR